MRHNGVYIIGAGGHAKVVIDILEKQGEYSVIGVLDDNPAFHGETLLGYTVIGDRTCISTTEQSGSMFLVAIGNNRIRQEISDELVSNGVTLISAVHPSVQISRNVDIGSGTVVMASCVINADTIIGKNVIINSNASVDHDCVIEDAVHIAPGVTLCGGVKVGFSSLIGAGVTVGPGVSIGANVVVGVGAVVISDIPNGQAVIGIPARPLNCRK
jgi:sugar O-acyltransferase (sialic acid O-acetyltransferase NeuD family)